MKPHRLVSPLQRAWLDELGVDTHWLATVPRVAVADVAPSLPAPAPELAPAPEPAPNAFLASSPVPSLAPELQQASERLPALEAVQGAQALAQAVQACLQPVAGGSRGPAVPGHGQWVRPQYFIVGEQPGVEDEALGRPFQGDPGRLLQAMLGAARLPRIAEAYFTTLVKCRLAGGRAPSPEEIAACLPYLQQEIAQVRPHWILALGTVAAQAVLQSTEGLDALRGRPQVWRSVEGLEIPVWVTFHPSSLLVRSADKLQAWRDLVALAGAVAAA